jgi:hypothetical protein
MILQNTNELGEERDLNLPNRLNAYFWIETENYSLSQSGPERLQKIRI